MASLLNPCPCGCEMWQYGDDLISMDAIGVLLVNLSIAAGLCRAFELGQVPPLLGPGMMIPLPSGGVSWIPDGEWRPGCQRPATGRSER